MVYVESGSPSSSAAVNRSPFLPGNSGWIGWWSPELLVALALDLQMFWEMMLIIDGINTLQWNALTEVYNQSGELKGLQCARHLLQLVVRLNFAYSIQN